MVNRFKLAVFAVLAGSVACASDDAGSGTTTSSAPSSAAAGSGSASATMPAATAAKPTEVNDGMPPTAAPTASASAGPAAMLAADETWSDGKMLASNVTIASGAKVTIAPGAKISVSPSVAILVQGSLEAAAKDNHAKLSGTNWAGIVVASGGSLKLVGVDLDGAKEAIHTNTGNTAAQYDYGTITGGLFRVDAGSTFTTDHAAVTTGGYSFLGGTVKATFLDYSGAAFALSDAAANVFVADSKITGSGGDFFTANGGQLLHVEYTTIDNTHCPFHFNTLTKYEIDHVTTGGTGAASTDAYGVMLYNGDAGPNTITNSNFNDPNWSQTRPTSAIAVTNTYIKSVPMKMGQVTFSPADPSGNNGHTEPNTDAHPRGTPGPG
jgi:hypothetical protein